jgi:aquaporin Z
VSQPAHSGWHWRIWAAEGAGTGLMMLGGLSAVCLTFGRGSFLAEALSSDSVRRLVAGALFAACVSLVAVSPLGRLSGAHLNPAVTLSFRVLGRVSRHDVGGYLVAQLAGALTGTALVWVVWGSTARSVDGGATAVTTSPAIAVALEIAMTAVLIGVILFFVSSMRLARWTPLAIWPVITALVWVGSPYTGTSLNPTRSAAPAVLFGQTADLWIFLIAPIVGALALALLWRSRDRGGQPKTAKLFHDQNYPCCLGTEMPAMPVHERSAHPYLPVT